MRCALNVVWSDKLPLEEMARVCPVTIRVRHSGLQESEQKRCRQPQLASKSSSGNRQGEPDNV